MKKDYNPMFLVLCDSVQHLFHIADDFHKAVVYLNNYSENTSDGYSFHLLATNAIELYLKTIIACDVCIFYNCDPCNTCNRNTCFARRENKFTEQEVKKKINSEIKKNSHNIIKIIQQSGLEKQLKITGMNEVPNDNCKVFVNEYRIKFDDHYELSIKDVEAIRYGSFARKPDVMIITCQNNRLKQFIDDLAVISQNKLFDTQEIFK